MLFKIFNFLGLPIKSNSTNYQLYCSGVKFPNFRGINKKNVIGRIGLRATDLLFKMLTFEPEKRITAEEALKHVIE